MSEREFSYEKSAADFTTTQQKVPITVEALRPLLPTGDIARGLLGVLAEGPGDTRRAVSLVSEMLALDAWQPNERAYLNEIGRRLGAIVPGDEWDMVFQGLRFS